MTSQFRITKLRFDNLSKFTVITHKVRDLDISKISQSIKAILKNIDRLDDDAKNLAGLLWVFKAILNATLISFDDPVLGLKERYQEILASIAKLNIDPALVETFKKSSDSLWGKHKNHKFERLLTLTNESIVRGEPVGLFGKILYGNDPACINSTISSLSNYGMKFANIQNKRQLSHISFQQVFIVAPPNRASADLMKSVFYTGLTPEVDLILYEHENFYAPTRVEMPISPVFSQNVQKFKASMINGVVNDLDKDDFELNSWVEESYWSDIHGGSRTKTALSVPAHYILFDGGEGAFMPAEGKILHIDKKHSGKANQLFDYNLSYVDILELTEGDYVLLRKNSSGFLLNESVEGIDDGDDDVLDEITDWKNALSALTITKDYSEIAQLMRARGVVISPGKIRQWEGIEVIAPNSETEFHCLIAVLANEGKLSSNIGDVNKYALDRWASIHDYRVSRQKAGNRARQTILDTLLEKIKDLDIDSIDGAKSLDSQLGQNLIIRRVASIDQSTSYVQQSSLYKIDDLRGNKWLR